ncbi:hypothetical protein, partial [Nocardia puris]|uniref:hypothetical protein n=1 Tax=Nocardia puris TaxID=208602 RepID=UPI001E2B0FE4
STGVPSRQRANAGLDQNPVTSSIIFREGAPSRDPQVLIIAPPFEIAITESDAQVVNGCRLFSISAVNNLLGQLYQHAGAPTAQRWTFRQRPSA